MTQLEKLKQVVENPKNYNIAKQSLAYKSIVSLTEVGKCYTAKSGYKSGYKTKQDWTMTVEAVLNQLGIKYEVRNDSPRGGSNGKYIQLTGSAILSQIVRASELNRK